jgi:hypothetical protein
MPETDNYPGRVTSPIYAGGSPIKELGDALASSQRVNRVEQGKDFWSTPSRPQASPIREVYEVVFDSPQRINYIDVALAKFPHLCYVQWLNPASGKWEYCTRPGSRTQKASVVISNSIPEVINPAATERGGHPQHYGAGHWAPHRIGLAPFTAKNVRLILVRSEGLAPRSLTGAPLPYSLGVKGFSAGYAVAGKEDVPRMPLRGGSIVEHEPFLRGRDSLGSSTEYFLREIRASTLITGGRAWRSGPQPINSAVVNLYVDARGPEGRGQVIDRFFIDPLYSGPSLNLYYTNDVIDGDFVSGSVPLSNSECGDLGTGPTKADTGLTFSGPAAFFIKNTIPQINTDLPYVVHMSLRMGFSSSSQEFDTRVPILSFLSGVFSWQAGSEDGEGRGFILTGGVVSGNEARNLLEFEQGDVINVSLYSDKTNLGMVINDGGLIQTGRNDYLGTQTILGGGDEGVEAPWQLVRMAIHEEPTDLNAASVFNADPAVFVDGSGYYQDFSGYERNAVLRYSPTFTTLDGPDAEPFGFLGGRGDPAFDIEWTPINRDFALRRGYLEFDPVRATYFKFEFSDLTPEPYEAVGSIWRDVKIFPRSMTRAQSRIFLPRLSGHAGGSGIVVSQQISPEGVFPDSYRVFYQTQNARPQSPYAPTEVIYSSDPDISSRLRAAGGYFNFTPWGVTAKPRFVQRGRHQYTSLKVQFAQRIAYFVGLKSLRMIRCDYREDSNTARYVENFLDDERIESGANDWVFDELGERLTTKDNTNVRVSTSTVFQSTDAVTGLQFATVQTPPVQILTDPNFDEPEGEWIGYGDSGVALVSDYSSILGDSMLVVRGGQSSDWNSLEARYLSWDALEDSDPDPSLPSWQALAEDPDLVDFGGIQSARPFMAEPGEDVYAAVRLYTDEPLDHPLVVEIFSSEDPTLVLAASSITPNAGELTEWYVAYRVGDGGVNEGETWGEVTSGSDIIPDGDTGTILWDSLADGSMSWNDIENSLSPYVGSMGVRVTQNEYARDRWWVDNISVFVDPIQWEFSNDGGDTFQRAGDIRNNPSGVLTFAESEPATNGLVWRVTGTRPNVSVSGLVMRPWYAGLPFGVPFRESVQIQGPVDSAYEMMPPVQNDPWFMLWDEPVPQDWWIGEKSGQATAQFAELPEVPDAPGIEE